MFIHSFKITVMKKKLIKIEEILSLHNQGLSITVISEKLNCTPTNVMRRLNKIGISSNKVPKRNRRTNRYKVDESYFEEIDTSEKAYILGLLYADGSVDKNGFYIKMKDEELLLKVKKSLKSEHPVKFVNYDSRYTAYILTVSSRKISKDLIKQGCFINKTYTLEFPNIEKSLYSHFVRGFFDGDGCLSISDNKSTCRFDLTSASTDLLISIREIISSFSKTNGNLRKENGKSNAWHLRFSGSQVIDVMNWIYKDSTIFMKRKHDKFLIYKSVHVKQDELLGSPREGNQQPSLDSNIFEGSTTNSRVLASNVEDSNADTSVLPNNL